MCLVRGRGTLHIFPGGDVLGAFYSEKLPGPGRTGRIVVLNTNLYYSNNEQTASMADPGQQFQWLEDVLSNASRAGEMVRAPPFSSPSLESLPEQVSHLHTNPSTLSRCPHHRGSSAAWHQEGAFSILRTACEAGTPKPITDVRLPRGGDDHHTVSGRAEARTPVSALHGRGPHCGLDLEGMPCPWGVSV